MINNSGYFSNNTPGVRYYSSLQIQLALCWSGFFFSLTVLVWGVYTFLKKNACYPQSKPPSSSETGISPSYSAL